MPSTITHAYMANDIYNRLNDDLKDKFKNQIKEYITYSQGPDVLFFYPIIPRINKSINIRKLASIVHRTKVNEFFISLVNNIKKDKDLEKFVFLAGLVTHYVGDSTCHPFINYESWLLKNKNKNNKDYHFLIEAYIDNYILNLYGEDYKKYKCHKLLKTDKNYKIKEMLDTCFKEVFDKNSMGSNYYKSLYNMKLLFYLVRYDPYKIKRIGYSIIYYVLPFIRRDIRYFSYNYNLSDKNNELFLNLDHKEWFNIRKKEFIYHKSFLELYKDTIDKSIYMIESLYDYIYNNKELDLDDFFGNLSYANGLKIESSKRHIIS